MQDTICLKLYLLNLQTSFYAMNSCNNCPCPPNWEFWIFRARENMKYVFKLIAHMHLHTTQLELSSYLIIIRNKDKILQLLEMCRRSFYRLHFDHTGFPDMCMQSSLSSWEAFTGDQVCFHIPGLRPENPLAFNPQQPTGDQKVHFSWGWLKDRVNCR